MFSGYTMISAFTLYYYNNDMKPYTMSYTFILHYMYIIMYNYVYHIQWRIEDLVEGGGGEHCHKQGPSPCPRHEVPSGGRVREGGVPHRERKL